MMFPDPDSRDGGRLLPARVFHADAVGSDYAARLALARLGAERRLVAAAERGVVLFVRTSTLEQARDTTRGSPSAQLEAGYEDAERIGVARTVVELIDAFGEAGTRKAKRVQFERLRALIRTGAVGLVIVPEHHRLSRNAADAEHLFNECADVRALLLINGQTFDPNVPNERYMLGMLAQFAQYENDARTKWLIRSRLARARQLRARMRLPMGLVWASRRDPAYVSAVAAAGDEALSAWVEAAKGNRAVSPAADGVREVTYEILPLPDPEVIASVRCRIDWMLETGSVHAVVDRIRAGHPGWPPGRRGMVPVALSSSRYRAGTTVSWEPASARPLYEFLDSPSLYGIYAYYGAALAAAAPPPGAGRRKGPNRATVAARERRPLPDASALLGAEFTPVTTGPGVAAPGRRSADTGNGAKGGRRRRHRLEVPSIVHLRRDVPPNS